MIENIALRVANQVKACEGSYNFLGFAEKREIPVRRVLENSVRKNETVSRLLDRFETVGEYDFQPSLDNDLHGYSPSLFRFIRDKVTDALYLIRKYGNPVINKPSDKLLFKPRTQVPTMTISHIDPGRFSGYLEIYRVGKNQEIIQDHFKYTTPYGQRRIIEILPSSSEPMREHFKEYRKP